MQQNTAGSSGKKLHQAHILQQCNAIQQGAALANHVYAMAHSLCNMNAVFLLLTSQLSLRNIKWIAVITFQSREILQTVAVQTVVQYFASIC